MLLVLDSRRLTIMPLFESLYNILGELLYNKFGQPIARA